MAGVWLIPKDAEKPADGRTRQGRKRTRMMQPYKIMVIEDDPIIQEELQTFAEWKRI